MPKVWVACLTCALLWATSAGAQTVAGADTLRVNGQLVRLYGIDVPDERQACDDGKWFPRAEAAAALSRFVGDRPVKCFQVYADSKTGQPVSICYAGEDDLQAFMVGQGWAWVVRPDTLKYINYERQAAALKLGVHAHRCDRADRWRNKNVGKGS